MQPGTMQAHSARHSSTLVWRIVLVAALLLLSVTPVFGAPSVQADLPCAGVTWNAVTDAPSTLRDCATASVSDKEPLAAARSFLRSYSDALGYQRGLADLEFVSLRNGLAGSHVVFRQMVDGKPVLNSYVVVHLNRDRQITLLQNGHLAQLNVPQTKATVSAVQAVQAARQAIEFTAPRGSSPAPQLAILPTSAGDGRLVWHVMIVAANPAGDWEVLVDAISGDVIKRTNLLVFDRGQILEPAAAGWIAAVQNPLRLSDVTLEGLDSSGWLRGEYVDLTALTGHRPARAFSPDGQFIYTPDDPRFEEVMVYYYVDTTQRYIQSLGYDNSNEPANGIRQRVTPASAHWFAQDQSFFSASDGALHYGDGGVEDAEDPDIIVHEYAHSLQQDQAPYWGGGEMDAIGEGFADYVAASRFAGQSTDPACIAERDSQAYVSGAPFCLRRVDRDRQYPVDLSGDPHQDGEIWSRVLWDLRGALGGRTADQLALESNFYLPPAATLPDAGQALLDADATLNNSANHATIRQALMRRGLQTLTPPGEPVADGGSLITPGSAVNVSWNSRGPAGNQRGAAQPQCRPARAGRLQFQPRRPAARFHQLWQPALAGQEQRAARRRDQPQAVQHTGAGCGDGRGRGTEL